MQQSFDSFGAFSTSYVPVPCSGVSGCCLPVCMPSGAPCSPCFHVRPYGLILWSSFPAMHHSFISASTCWQCSPPHPPAPLGSFNLYRPILRSFLHPVSSFFVPLFFPCFFEDIMRILKFYAALFIWSLFLKGFPQMPDSCLLISNVITCWWGIPALSLSGAPQTLPSQEEHTYRLSPEHVCLCGSRRCWRPGHLGCSPVVLAGADGSDSHGRGRTRLRWCLHLYLTVDTPVGVDS